MSIEKLFILFLFSAIVLSFLAPVDAFSIQQSDKNTIEYINGKSIVNIAIVTDVMISEARMKDDLNRIDKIVVKVNNKKVNTIRKGRGWNKYKYYPIAIVDRGTIVKGNIKGKNVTIITYGKSGKVINKSTNIVKTVHAKTTKNINSKYPPNARLTYQEALKEAEDAEIRPTEKLVYIGYYFFKGDLFWSFEIHNAKKHRITSFDIYDLYGSMEAT